MNVCRFDHATWFRSPSGSLPRARWSKTPMPSDLGNHGNCGNQVSYDLKRQCCLTSLLSAWRLAQACPKARMFGDQATYRNPIWCYGVPWWPQPRRPVYVASRTDTQFNEICASPSAWAIAVKRLSSSLSRERGVMRHEINGFVKRRQFGLNGSCLPRYAHLTTETDIYTWAVRFPV